MKLFADSACDLPLPYFAENHVTLLPLVVIMDQKEADDLTEVNPLNIYDHIRAGGQPKTSQASPELFEKRWKELVEQQEDGLYIAFSSELTGTYATATMVRDQVLAEVENPPTITIIDTKCASFGYGLVVKEAVRLRDAGYSLTEITTRIQKMANHMQHLFTVEDLDYLARGGRVSKASAFIGGLLNIKPLLHVEDGKLIPLEKHRGRKKVFRRIIEVMKSRGKNIDWTQQTIGISHGDDLESAMYMKRLIEEHLQPKEIQIELIGSVIAAHAGPGTIAVFFLDEANESL